MILLAVDPGIRGCGAALFDGSTLARVAYVVSPFASGNQAGESAAMAAAVAEWAGVVDLVVIEWPRVYATRIRAGQSSGDPNDLLALAGVDAAVAALVGARSASYCPSDWKGNVPKDVMGARILGRLSAAEQSLVMTVTPAGKRHNAIDAVGVGLFHLGRLAPRRAA